MGKSDSLKNGMRSGLDGLLSSTGKSTQKKEPKRACCTLQLCHKQKYSYPDEVPRHRKEYVSTGHRERGDERVFGKAREITGTAVVVPIRYTFYSIPLSYGHVHKVAFFLFIPSWVFSCSITSYNRMVVLLFYLFHLPLVRPRSCHRRLVFQTQIWTAALDFTALKCISRKILPSCERVIFRKKR